MPDPAESKTTVCEGSPQFHTTHWSAVLAAGDPTASTARESLERLCRTYWYPLYAHLRRRGFGVEEAKDLTQGFFARLLEMEFLAEVHPGKGKFRSFLIAALEHFCANEWDRAQAAKRGGGQRAFSLDDSTAEARFQLEPACRETPATLFDRQWALAVLEQAMVRLAEEMAAAKKGGLFSALRVFLAAEPAAGEYAACGAKLNMTPNAVGIAVHRLRARFQELVRSEVAQTLNDPAGVQEELGHLRSALAQNI